MTVWATTAAPGALEQHGRPVPEPAPGEVLVQVEACGACRTDLHVIDHELRVGERVGVAWLRRTCGACRWCRDGRENLCPASQYTGWDADGGYAEFTTVPEAFAYPLPADTDPVRVAPLLCAGIIGYRALSRANLPPGGRLGVYGFGSSAHITAQLAMAAGAEVYAMTRGERNRGLARRLKVAFVGDETAAPPASLDAAIVFAPAGELVPVALHATQRGGTVVLAGIHMSTIPALGYEQNLFLERDLRTVTANTRADGAAFLRLAHTHHITPTITRYPFARAGDAVRALRAGSASGSLVLADP